VPVHAKTPDDRPIPEALLWEDQWEVQTLIPNPQALSLRLVHPGVNSFILTAVLAWNFATRRPRRPSSLRLIAPSLTFSSTHISGVSAVSACKT
jgi:hypothetical protein